MIQQEITTMDEEQVKILREIQNSLDSQEQQRLSKLATRNCEAVRRRGENSSEYRQSFAQDADRILHSKAYSRYIDKTQVFSLIDNDHITHRVLHVQMVSRIGRTIGRFLGLNEDLIEAIALGHDIGHPPFGHEGEKILAKICRDHGLASFHHNVQSVQFLDRFEKKGVGWNLSLQVLDGILCHDGEVHDARLVPMRDKTFADFDREMAAPGQGNAPRRLPMTLEGCVVRLADTISYIGRDIEDAIELRLIDRSEIPADCAQKLGVSNGKIVYNLVSDLILNSLAVRDAVPVPGHDSLGFSPEMADLLLALKQFNYRRIYLNPAFKPDFALIHICYEKLFDHYLHQLRFNRSTSEMGRLLHSMAESYLNNHEEPALVRDYIAGMTDDYFLHQARAIGCPIPKRKCLPN